MAKLPFFSLLLFLLFSPSLSHPHRPFACGGEERSLPFCSTSLPIPERVKDLIGRLTLPEKIRLLVNNASPVRRLGIRRYEWWSEALHGVSNVGPGTRFGGKFPGATSFPQVISTAASFNASLWEEIGRVGWNMKNTVGSWKVSIADIPIPTGNGLATPPDTSQWLVVGACGPHHDVVSDEGRAMYNRGWGGLTYWSPNVNIFRDPRWGRGQETPGEDPVLAGKYASSYVNGLQQPYGKDGDRLKVAACCKHYTAYDLDNWKGTDRFHFNAKVSKQDLEDTYDVPFKACVEEGKVASVMCSYNQVNGIPTCADGRLLRNTIRGAWGLNGYIVSDCDSVGVFYDSQHYTSTPEDAAAEAIKAGLDLDCGPFLAVHTGKAIRSGKLSEADVNGALTNTLTVQMRLGMFDSDLSTQPFGQLGPRDVCTQPHQELALEAARQGIVLLKNHRHALPLSPQRIRTVAVIGPNSNVTATMIGNYAGIPCEYTTPLQGIAMYAKTIHQPGCDSIACDNDRLFGAATDAARQADATVLVMGLDQSIEAETLDRESLLLPGRQQELVSKVTMASKGPTVLVLMCGGPIDVSFAKTHHRIPSIFWVGYPGQAGGRAIADVIFGEFNPGGRLPVTWYPHEFTSTVPMTSMGMRSDPSKGYPGRTYRFYNGEVVYPFGHGLTYTKFVHTLAQAPTMVSVPLDGHRVPPHNATISGPAVRVTHARCSGLAVGVHVDVKNVGSKDGAHALLIYSVPPAGQWAPRKQLVAFQKVHVPSKSQTRIRFSIHVCKHLSVVDSYGIRRIPIGEHSLQIGDLTHSISLHAETV